MTGCKLSWIGDRMAARVVSSLILLIFSIHPTYSQSERWGVKRLVEYHQQVHPQLQAQDVYKLFYQASFGVEHILSDSAEVVQYLFTELASVDTPFAGEPLLERISLEDDLVRVNLRPFKALNLGPRLLVQVMAQSAHETNPDTILFYRQWNEFSALVRFGVLKFPLEDLNVWLATIEGGSVKPVHHSSKYSFAHRPAYRVVRRKLFEEVFGKTKQ